MELSDLKRILMAFADRPDDLIVSPGKILIEVLGQQIEADLTQRADGLMVIENGTRIPVTRWIQERVARLPILAERLLEFVPDVKDEEGNASPNLFITPAGQLSDPLDGDYSGDPRQVESAVETCHRVLDRKPLGVCSTLYLTSDAGEGKTTLIDRLARHQAERFKKREVDWLLVPIPLAGRAFLRFDEVVTGVLSSRYRFPGLYHEAFIELIRLGAIVPAFDGYEEMFIAGGTDSAVTTMGNMIRSLRSAGTVLVASRKSFFDYKGFDSERLAGSFGDVAYSPAELRLSRWDKSRFMDYGARRCVPDVDSLYDAVLERANGNIKHPLLTRAVLVRRLMTLAEEAPTRDNLLARLSDDNKDFFGDFIATILDREAKEKWIDRSADPQRQLTTIEEHHDLLAAIAHEMWLDAAEDLSTETLQVVAELFSEAHGFGIEQTRQVIERLRSPALLVADGVGRRYRFDHEEFLHHFLGDYLGCLIRTGKGPELRTALRKNLLPAFATDRAAVRVRQSPADILAGVKLLNDLCQSEMGASFVRQNAGEIAIRLASESQLADLHIHNAMFGEGSLSGRILSDVTFTDCYFLPTGLKEASLQKCIFSHCEFEEINLSDRHTDRIVNNHCKDDCKVRSVVPPGRDQPVFAPDAVRGFLHLNGFLQPSAVSSPPTQAQPEPDLAEIEYLYTHTMKRSRQFNENTLKVKVGVNYPDFRARIMPKLLDSGFLALVQYTGSGNQQRYKLNRKDLDISEALEGCGGKLAKFLELIQKQSAP